MHESEIIISDCEHTMRELQVVRFELAYVKLP